MSIRAPDSPAEIEEEVLPSFGATVKDNAAFKDPYQDQHDEINELVGKLSMKSEEDHQQPRMMSNDDSFSNIAPAMEKDNDAKQGEQNIDDLNLDQSLTDKEIAQPPSK